MSNLHIIYDVQFFKILVLKFVTQHQQTIIPIPIVLLSFTSSSFQCSFWIHTATWAKLNSEGALKRFFLQNTMIIVR